MKVNKDKFYDLTIEEIEGKTFDDIQEWYESDCKRDAVVESLFLYENNWRGCEIATAIEEYEAKVWYVKHMNLRYRVSCQGETVDPEIFKQAINRATEIENKYGVENLGPFDDFEWGMINGKLSALRWATSSKMDFLDT